MERTDNDCQCDCKIVFHKMFKHINERREGSQMVQMKSHKDAIADIMQIIRAFLLGRLVVSSMTSILRIWDDDQGQKENVSK